MTPDEVRRPGERTFALVLVVLSAFILSEAYSISGFEGLTTGGVMPLLGAGIMLVCSICILAEAQGKRPVGSSESGSWLAYLLPLRLVCFTGLVVLYAGLIPSLGFLSASGGFLFVAIWLLWRRGPMWSLLITGLAVVSIHLLFRVVFQVVLPAGALWR